eukprot:m.255447 g.255447  ORF g.255447 m.255447 type:complete len:392 (-) comp19615_c0_seq8:572-1747(-)
MSDGSQYLPTVWQLIVISMLLLLGGVFSGLSLGLMQMDPNRLKIVAKSGTPQMKKFAKIIYPIRRNGNYLLCVLLIGNVLTNNTLAILLEQLTGGIVAIIASTGSITVFGEIIPQAICGRHPLATGAYTIWITWFFYVVLSPVAYPVSLLLNYLMGKEIGVYYLREELSELLRLTQSYSDIDRDELGILGGGLSLKSTCVEEIMVPVDKVVMIDGSVALTRQVLLDLSACLYSRIPVYQDNPNNVVGVLLVHDLVSAALGAVDEETRADGTGLRRAQDVMFPMSPARLTRTTSLHDTLLKFKVGESHLALVLSSNDHIEGGCPTWHAEVVHELWRMIIYLGWTNTASALSRMTVLPTLSTVFWSHRHRHHDGSHGIHHALPLSRRAICPTV